MSGLVKGNDGSMYGTAEGGGVDNEFGTIFKITPDGIFTTLVSFEHVGHPEITLASAGNFYGTVANSLYGEVFQMKSDGSKTTLVSFAQVAEANANPRDALIVGRDGNLYGTSRNGGADLGTVFRIVFPSLNSRINGNELVLSWPTNADEFTLQSAMALDFSTNWIDSTNPPAVVDGRFTVTNSVSESARFYRLRKQF